MKKIKVRSYSRKYSASKLPPRTKNGRFKKKSSGSKSSSTKKRTPRKRASARTSGVQVKLPY